AASAARHRRGRRTRSVATADALHHAGRLRLSRPHRPHAQVPARAAAARGAGTRRAPDRGRGRVILNADPGSSSGGTAFAPLPGRGRAEGDRGLRRGLFWVSALLLGWSGEAVAQTWRTKPIRAIVAFAAGSATDVIPRVVFEPLSAQLGQPIVVEN